MSQKKYNDNLSDPLFRPTAPPSLEKNGKQNRAWCVNSHCRGPCNIDVCLFKNSAKLKFLTDDTVDYKLGGLYVLDNNFTGKFIDHTISYTDNLVLARFFSNAENANIYLIYLIL